MTTHVLSTYIISMHLSLPFRCPCISFPESHPFTIASVTPIIVPNDEAHSSFSSPAAMSHTTADDDNDKEALDDDDGVILQVKEECPGDGMNHGDDEIDSRDAGSQKDRHVSGAKAAVGRIRTLCHIRAGPPGTWTHALMQKALKLPLDGEPSAWKLQGGWCSGLLP